MKALIKKIEFDKEVETKFGGTMFAMNATYVTEHGTERVGSFLVKDKEKLPFTPGEENEFTETQREYNGNIYYNIKAIKQTSQSNYGKARGREQTKYSGFAVSYVKDLIVSGVLQYDSKDEMLQSWKNLSENVFWHMVNLDKKLET